MSPDICVVCHFSVQVRQKPFQIENSTFHKLAHSTCLTHQCGAARRNRTRPMHCGLCAQQLHCLKPAQGSAQWVLCLSPSQVSLLCLVCYHKGLDATQDIRHEDSGHRAQRGIEPVAPSLDCTRTVLMPRRFIEGEWPADKMRRGDKHSQQHTWCSMVQHTF